jgi:hypothetical protein
MKICIGLLFGSTGNRPLKPDQELFAEDNWILFIYEMNRQLVTVNERHLNATKRNT